MVERRWETSLEEPVDDCTGFTFGTPAQDIWSQIAIIFLTFTHTSYYTIEAGQRDHCILCPFALVRTFNTSPSPLLFSPQPSMSPSLLAVPALTITTGANPLARPPSPDLTLGNLPPDFPFLAIATALCAPQSSTLQNMKRCWWRILALPQQ